MRKNRFSIIYYLFISLFVLQILFVPATLGAVETWEKTFSRTNNDEGECLIQTSDGGYAIGGTSGLEINFWLVKIDGSGNEQWAKTYGQGRERGYSVIQTNDGGYAMVGITWQYGPGSSDFWLVKIDGSGNEQWAKAYGGTHYDEGYSVVQTSDGGFAIAGYTESFGAGGTDGWLIRVDSGGNLLWNKTFGGTNYDYFYSIISTIDGGFALAGKTYSFGAGNTDFWVVKTDSSGNLQWNKTYGKHPHDDAYCLIQTSDGGYAIAGTTQSYGELDPFDVGNPAFWLVKTDPNGVEQWNQFYGGTIYDEAYSLVQTSDGGYALVGFSYVERGRNKDFWLGKVDGNGNQQWAQTFDRDDFDEAKSIIQTNDGGYGIVGTKQTFPELYSSIWFIKTDEYGNIDPTSFPTPTLSPTPTPTQSPDPTPTSSSTPEPTPNPEFSFPMEYAIGGIVAVVAVVIAVFFLRRK